MTALCQRRSLGDDGAHPVTARMQFFDATTLLLVNAVFNTLAALAWAMLAGVFRVAPRACWLLAGAHLARVFALRCYDCRITPPWQAWPWMPELFALLTIGLLCLGVRQLLRLTFVWRDMAALGLAGGAAVLALGLWGRTGWMLVAGSATGLLMAITLCRDIVTGARSLRFGPWLVPMLLPYAGLMLALGWRGLRALSEPVATVPAMTVWLWLVLSMASSLSLIALVLHRLISRINQLSLHDPLTGALNRRAVIRRLQLLLTLAQRGHPFSLVLLDLDHFKAINDRHGHAGGDAALVHAVRVLGQTLRDGDELARLGGEEFCALLPHTDLASAAQVAERLRAQLAAEPCRWHGSDIMLTASFGVVQARPGELRAEALLMQADQLLYRAKAAGRNQVSVDSPDEGDEDPVLEGAPSRPHHEEQG